MDEQERIAYDKLKGEARKAFAVQRADEGRISPWFDIEFEQWWLNDKRETCMNKRNKSNTTRCYRPCEHCLELRVRGV